MKKWLLLSFMLFVLTGCKVGDDEDTDSSFDTGDTGDVNEGGYVCLPDEVDTEACGTYPEHDNDMWDLYAVVPNTSFPAYYDRDCDGTPELTTMRMYEDVYCHRDTIKSLVLLVGSNCGSADGAS